MPASSTLTEIWNAFVRMPAYNALIKLIVHYFLENKLPLSNKILGFFGRIGF